MLKTVKHRRYSLKLDSYRYLYAVLSVVLPGNKLVHFAFHDTSSQCEVFQDFFGGKKTTAQITFHSLSNYIVRRKHLDMFKVGAKLSVRDCKRVPYGKKTAANPLQ